MTLVPRGHSAVMASRVEPPDSLDFFPTPPWATRALLGKLSLSIQAEDVCWEPACGAGHMSDVLAEQPWRVFASDVFDYGHSDAIGSFVGAGPDVVTPPAAVDWVITNPPFNLAEEFVLRALKVARIGVAVLVRTGWLDTIERHNSLFGHVPPFKVIQFSERVPMIKGRWDPSASTATPYCWVVWLNTPGLFGMTRLEWFPPGTKARFSCPDDIARFAHRIHGGAEKPIDLFNRGRG